MLDAGLSAAQVEQLRGELAGRKIVFCFGGGVDSTALIVVLRAAGIRPEAVTFADTGGEKPETIEHVTRMSELPVTWGWPPVSVCRKRTKPETGYSDLEGNCLSNETLPSLAFGMKSCSLKWKQGPQDQFLMGVKSGPNACDPHPVWVAAQASGERILKLIGYDAGKADVRRSKNFSRADKHFDYAYPLQTIGFQRPDCVRAIATALGAEYVPIKSACFFCPASKHWGLFWLAAYRAYRPAQPLRCCGVRGGLGRPGAKRRALPKLEDDGRARMLVRLEPLGAGERCRRRGFQGAPGIDGSP